MLDWLLFDVLLKMLSSALVITAELRERTARTSLGTGRQVLLDLATRALLESTKIRTVDRDRLAHLKGKRASHLCEKYIGPVSLSKVSAGFPSPMDGYASSAGRSRLRSSTKPSEASYDPT